MQALATWTATLLAAGALSVGAAAPAEAHHGFGGRYDSSQPLWVSGTVTTGTFGLPHGLITLRPEAPAAPPADVRELPAEQLASLGDPAIVATAQPLQATGDGVLTLLLPPPMTGAVARLARPPAPGDTVGAVVLRECDSDELRVQVLRLSAAQRVVRGGVVQNEVRGCGAPAQPGPASEPVTQAVATSAPASGRHGPIESLALATLLAAALTASAGPLLHRIRARDRRSAPMDRR